MAEQTPPSPPGPSGRADQAALLSLLQRVADRDRDAFVELHALLSSAVLDELGTQLPDPATAATVACATFVEVWCLARFHRCADTDVAAWVRAIATRRAAERAPLVEAGAQTGAGQQVPAWRAVVDTHDRQTELVLANLLGLPNERPRDHNGLTVPVSSTPL